MLLECTARNAGLLLAPAEGFGRGRGFFALWAKKRAFHAVCAFLGHFSCSVETSVVISCNVSNFENNIKI